MRRMIPLDDVLEMGVGRLIYGLTILVELLFGFLLIRFGELVVDVRPALGRIIRYPLADVRVYLLPNVALNAV